MKLADFQDDFIHALYADDGSLARQPGFRVYRNTVIKGCVDALQANYPTVERLVGEEWFRAAATIHARATPPTDARLLHYGRDFAGFLDSFEPARELPYLADIARLDRYWIESHTALDEAALDATDIAGPGPDTVWLPHPATRWTWFEAQPIFSIWRANREELAVDDELPWIGEGALLTRRDGQVRWTAISRGTCTFLDACAAGQPLTAAAQAMLLDDSDVEIAPILTTLLAMGAFVSTSP
jgi:hypothetical protein